MKIKLIANKGIDQNAQIYFEKAKKARKKLAGAIKALDEAKHLLEKEKLKSDEEIRIYKESKIHKVVRKKEWFEKFRWFYTSKGHLVVGGRDATTNEIVIKKHTATEDIIFHTDMAGSPFFVVKLEGDKATEEEIKEVANATLTFSRGWKLGLTTTNVFWVTPEQVSKEANSGEFMPKGAFMIRGKTNYVHCQIDCVVGFFNGRVEAGPFNSLKDRCTKLIKIVQGKRKSGDVAKVIQKELGGELDEIIRVLPSGGFDIA